METGTWVALVVGGLVVVGVIFAVVTESNKTKRLQESGVRATAQVISASQTGSWAADNPEVELELQIRRDDGAAPYVKKFRQTVPVINQNAVQPGSALRMLVSPTDPDEMMIDEAWAK